MTGPADDAELVVKMMNSGAPGVMLDLEDSMVNEWEHQQLGQANILSALRGSLTYFDKKRDSVVGIKPSATVTWIRPRGLHISQDGVLAERTSASLFDVASIAFRVDASELKHPLAFYHLKIRIGGRGVMVARCISGDCGNAGLAPQLHQVHGTRGIASAGISDGRVSV